MRKNYILAVEGDVLEDASVQPRHVQDVGAAYRKKRGFRRSHSLPSDAMQHWNHIGADP